MSLNINAAPGTGGGGTPGGSDTELQYNNAGSFGGISGITSDGITLRTNNGIQLLGRDFVDANWLPMLELNDFDQIVLGDNAEDYFFVDSAQHAFCGAITDGSGSGNHAWSITSLGYSGNDNLGNSYQLSIDASAFGATVVSNFTDIGEISVGTQDGKIEMSGTATAKLEWSATSGIFSWQRADDGAEGGIFTIVHDSNSPAANDVSYFRFDGKDAGGNDVTYGEIGGIIVDPTDSAADGRLGLYSAVNSVSTLGAYVEGGQLFANAGSNSAPGLTFTGLGANGGLYSGGANDLRVVLSGTDRWRFLSNSLRGNASTEATPQITLSNDADTGLYIGVGFTGLTVDGVSVVEADTTGLGFFNVTPVARPTTGIAEAAFVENSGGTAVNVDSTFGGYTLQQIAQALQNLGLLT